jgi:two-component system, LytTR family, sensor kinase
MITDIVRRLGLKGKYTRYLLHLIFWSIAYLFYIYLKKPLLGLSYGFTALVVIKDVIVIAIIFYFLSYYVVPKVLLKKRFFLLILCLISIYYFYATTIFLDFSLLPKLIEIPGRGYHSYAARVTSAGYIGILKLNNAVEILLDLSYLLSPALIVKLLAKLVDLTTQSLKLQMENLNLELAFLKAQINPHFLFNTLNNVYSLALHKSDRTADVILKLSDLMRYTLYESNTAMVSLSEDIKFFENYVELERIRHSSKVTITYEVHGDYENLSIAPLIVFPFIENAFKHGLHASAGRSWVIMKLTVKDGVLSVSIRNSKHASRKNGSNVGGIGISNTKKRLDLLYANRHTLDISSTDEEFSVNMAIQLMSSRATLQKSSIEVE